MMIVLLVGWILVDVVVDVVVNVVVDVVVIIIMIVDCCSFVNLYSSKKN
jgi:hypothetical protein